MELKECFEKGFVKKTSPDEGLIRSLIEMSAINEQIVRETKSNESTISAFVSLAYESLRQVLEALCISNGYKVINHICIGELLNSILKDFDYDEFDRMRWIRNSINYYGEKIKFEQGKELIKKIFILKHELLNKYLKEHK